MSPDKPGMHILVSHQIASASVSIEHVIVHDHCRNVGIISVVIVVFIILL